MNAGVFNLQRFKDIEAGHRIIFIFFPTNSVSSFDKAFSPDMPKSFLEDSTETSSVASLSLRFWWYFLCCVMAVALD